MADKEHARKSVGVRTNFHLQFITTPTSDTPGTSLVLHFDTKRYIFGEIAEGTQRACIQRGIGLRKVRGLFLSGRTHYHNDGFIGLLLTLADVQQGELENPASNKRPRLHVYAGPKHLHAVASARRFVFRTGIPLSVHEVVADDTPASTEPIHEDDNIKVWALPTQPRADPLSSPAMPEDDEWPVPTMEHQRDKVDRTPAQIAGDQALREQVVQNMFDSDWHRDQLVQRRLAEIKLPALVWVRDPATKTLKSHTCFDMENIAPLTPQTEILVRTPWPASTIEELPPASDLPDKVAMSYIIKGHAQRGSFDPVKAKNLGLKPGPDYRNLVAGKSVELKTGFTITPEMVLTPSRPAKGIAIFDLPTLSHLRDLRRQIDARSDNLLEGVEIAVWMTRGAVAFSPDFKEILQKLTGMKHVLSDPSICNDYVAQDSSALSSLRLASIAPSLFPVPRYDNLNSFRPICTKHTQDLRGLLELPHGELDVLAAERGLKIHIEPKVLLDGDEVPQNQDLKAIDMPLELSVQESLPEDMSPYHAETCSQGRLENILTEPEIITLGTGSAAPSKYRNVSATLLRMPDGLGNYLFDCGEGTLGQLKRLYNADELDEILGGIRAIWISHLHADHHLGTLPVLQAILQSARSSTSGPDGMRRQLPLLISEVNMMDYVADIQSVLGIPTESLCTPVACHWTAGLSLRGQPFDFKQTDVPIRQLRSVKVNHCHGAQAVSVTFTNGFKFSYSGDCRPNELFCRIGEDSDVLVHEATFDDGMEGDACAKKHCTTGEAVGVALGMRAKNLILTHFSQRYQKIPVLSGVKMPETSPAEDLIDDVDGDMMNGVVTNLAHSAPKSAASSESTWMAPDAANYLNVAVAFDLMRIKVSQIKSMKALFPAITKMFEIEEEKRERQRAATAAALQQDIERKKGVKMLNAQKKSREKQREVEEQARKKPQPKRGLDTGVGSVTTESSTPRADHTSFVARPSSPAVLDGAGQQASKVSTSEPPRHIPATPLDTHSVSSKEPQPGAEMDLDLDPGLPSPGKRRKTNEIVN